MYSKIRQTKNLKLEVFMKKVIFVTFLITISLPTILNAEFKPIEKLPITSYSGDFTIWQGKIWQVDIVFYNISIFDLENGAYVKSITTPGFNPYSISVFKDTLIVSNDDEICFIDSDGKIYRTISSPASSITGLASDGNYIWITEERGKIYCISADDGTTIKTLEGPEGRINGLGYSDGYLWTTSRYRDEIYMIEVENGEVINILPSPGPYPSGIFVKEDKIYISDFEKDSIFIYLLPYTDYILTQDTKKAQITLHWEIVNSGPGVVGDVDVYLAIPGDLPNQRLLKEPEFTPKPDDILTDQYGQKVACYQLKDIQPMEHHTAKAIIEAELSSVNYFIMPERVKSSKEIPKEIKKTYLRDSERFRIKDPFIQKAVKEAIGDERNPYWIARKVLNYVADKIDYERIRGWDVAPEVLKRGKGSCSEYAYVYISMMRAAGVPARYVGSVVERGDRASLDGVFHRWIEIFLPGYGWVPVDPGVADSPYPRRKALAIGHRSNRYLITTIGGGDSEYLDWSYNFNEKIKNYAPRTNFMVRRYAIWEPLLEKE